MDKDMLRPEAAHGYIIIEVPSVGPGGGHYDAGFRVYPDRPQGPGGLMSPGELPPGDIVARVDKDGKVTRTSSSRKTATIDDNIMLSRGYEDGYHGKKHDTPDDPGDPFYYDQGYVLGRDDRKNGKPESIKVGPDYSRLSSRKTAVSVGDTGIYHDETGWAQWDGQPVKVVNDNGQQIGIERLDENGDSMFPGNGIWVEPHTVTARKTAEWKPKNPDGSEKNLSEWTKEDHEEAHKRNRDRKHDDGWHPNPHTHKEWAGNPDLEKEFEDEPRNPDGTWKSSTRKIAEIPSNVGARDMDPQVLKQQIGSGNILAISGGRVSILTKSGKPCGIELPVSSGYKVRVYLANDDTYTVQRVFRDNVKGELTGVYAEDVGEQAYQAGMYQSNEFGGHRKGSTRKVAWTIEDINNVLEKGWYDSKVDGTRVDAFTAGAIKAVYNATSPANQALLTSKPIEQAASICFKVLNKNSALAPSATTSTCVNCGKTIGLTEAHDGKPELWSDEVTGGVNCPRSSGAHVPNRVSGTNNDSFWGAAGYGQTDAERDLTASRKIARELRCTKCGMEMAGHQTEDWYGLCPLGGEHTPEWGPDKESSRKQAVGLDDWDTIMQSREMKAVWPQIRQLASELLSAQHEGSGNGISSSDINHTVFGYAQRYWDGSHLDVAGLGNALADELKGYGYPDSYLRSPYSSKTADSPAASRPYLDGKSAEDTLECGRCERLFDNGEDLAFHDCPGPVKTAGFPPPTGFANFDPNQPWCAGTGDTPASWGGCRQCARMDVDLNDQGFVKAHNPLYRTQATGAIVPDNQEVDFDAAFNAGYQDAWDREPKNRDFGTDMYSDRAKAQQAQREYDAGYANFGPRGYLIGSKTAGTTNPFTGQPGRPGESWDAFGRRVLDHDPGAGHNGEVGPDWGDDISGPGPDYDYDDHDPYEDEDDNAYFQYASKTRGGHMSGSMQERYATARKLASTRHFADEDVVTCENCGSQNLGDDSECAGCGNPIWFKQPKGLGGQVNVGAPNPWAVQDPNPLAGQDLQRFTTKRERIPATLLEASLMAEAESDYWDDETEGQDPYDERHWGDAPNFGTSDYDEKGNYQGYMKGENGYEARRTAADRPEWGDDESDEWEAEQQRRNEAWQTENAPHDQLDDPWNNMPSAGDY